jgi:hypothetical protein
MKIFTSKHATHHGHIASAIALTLAVAAGAAPAAWADPQPLAQAEAAAVNHPTRIPASTGPCSEACSAGGYGSMNQPALTQAGTGAALPHDPRPRSEVVSGGGYGPVSVPSTVVRVVAPSGGFDWGDAGIGAGGAFALTMIGLGGVLAATNRHRRHPHQRAHANS